MIFNAQLKKIDQKSKYCSQSPPRPESLMFESIMTNLDMELADSENNNGPCSMNIRTRNKKKKRRAADNSVKKFEDLYTATGEILGNGACAAVKTYKKNTTNKEYAVKVIEKDFTRSRNKVFKEIEIFSICQGQDNILQLFEYFEEEDRFYLVFEKMKGGTLLANIERRGHLCEREAALVVKQIAIALNFLHQKGIAHRDLKPDNILCERTDEVVPIRICDFDLASGVPGSQTEDNCTTPELLTPVGSVEYMAPEVVDAWVGESFSYDKKCDLWSLGIILYIMLCGYPPFYGQCGGDCGWERGEACQSCQETLFTRIQDGMFEFPDNEWGDVSNDVKDLIQKLLVREPRKRLTALEVLQHPWITCPAAPTPLATPGILTRNNSTKDLECFAGEAVSINRMMQQHLLISEPPNFFIGGRDDFDCDAYESGDDDDKFNIPSFKLSPPSSGLAKRRTMARKPNNLSEITEDSSDSGCSLPSSHSSSCGISI
ncbi:MAP kinase-interacting serine/threonine-protein kinase 1-like isoform X2 [Mytilus galloprovincialis]|uniref:MAP kinase-interacting serine/threonine-protein kinase 1-like isoform X1 n=1 Tax=Mytilus edulis TaxID=6550 RepID=UPI0039EF22B4